MVAGPTPASADAIAAKLQLDSGQTIIMTQPDSTTTQPVRSAVYTREYFTRCCQGYEEFSAMRGRVLPLRLHIPLELADIRPGMQVVDVGCGRGELILHCARCGAQVWGLDYAREAVHLAHESLTSIASPAVQANLGIQQGDAQYLPFSDASVDAVFMLDVVEHLLPDELGPALDEVWRILRPGGRLVVHTMPNLWYYRFGYPLYRGLQWLRSRHLPADPRDRWPFRDVHVNEQDPIRLRRVLRAHRFQTRVWLATTQTYDYETNSIVRRGMHFVTHVYPFRWIFCNDIFAIGTKSWDYASWIPKDIGSSD